jgi:uncharacterized protein (TIGR03382 family)
MRKTTFLGCLAVLASSSLAGAQEAVLTPSLAADQGWGAGVAITGDGSRAVVGSQSGAMVFVRSGTSWTEEDDLFAIDLLATDGFGRGVAISADGTRALVGAEQDDTADGVDAGSAHVFVRSGSAWTREATLRAPNGAALDRFGCSVALSGDGTRALVGACGDTTANGVGAGTAALFVRTSSSWALERELGPSMGTAGGAYGSAVALSTTADYALVGARGEGAVYVYARSGLAWILLSRFTGDRSGFGRAVALSGDASVALVGSDDGARVLSRAGSSWSEGELLRGAGVLATDLFGAAVALDVGGGRALVGARADDGHAGAVYVFARANGAWSEQAVLRASGRAAGDRFGVSVAISGDGARAAIGADGDDMLVMDSGTARIHLLELEDGTACASSSGCGSGFCADGVCCESACGGGAIDCQACSAVAGGTRDGACTPLRPDLASVASCRPAAGPCDLSETCRPTSTECPADAYVAGGPCREARGACDVAESCDGRSPACPPDGFAEAGVVCRAAAGACDVAETCNGWQSACPSDAVLSDGTSCADGDVCDGAEVCSAGRCADVAPLSCDDADACTADACDATGCTHAPVSCDDADACTADACDATGCTHAPVSCDDADACTADACDAAAGCMHAAIEGCCAGDADCDDGDACTADACGEGLCANEPIVGCGARDAGLERDAGQLEDAGTELADAGMELVDAGALSADAALEDAGVDPPVAGGCAAAPSGTSAAPWIALLAVVIVRRRVRR